MALQPVMCRFFSNFKSVTLRFCLAYAGMTLFYFFIPRPSPCMVFLCAQDMIKHQLPILNTSMTCSSYYWPSCSKPYSTHILWLTFLTAFSSTRAISKQKNVDIGQTLFVNKPFIGLFTKFKPIEVVVSLKLLAANVNLSSFLRHQLSTRFIHFLCFWERASI